jgi:hypothetical protein
VEFQQVAVYIEEGNQAKEFIYNYLEWIAASIAEAPDFDSFIFLFSQCANNQRVVIFGTPFWVSQA